MENREQIKDFSRLGIVMDKFKSELADKARYAPVVAFPDGENSERQKWARIKKAKSDFWYFDQTYFLKNMYSDGYSKPAGFHKEMTKEMNLPGIKVFLGARKHGKTALAKKYLVWRLLSGKTTFAGTLSQTLTTSRNILSDIFSLIADNNRILSDFKPEFEEANSDQLTFKVEGSATKIRVMAFSEGRSVRGATRLFDRPQFILCDDVETRQSALGEDQTVARIKMINEAFHSMSDKGTLAALGNNFDERCAFNRLVVEQKEGLLADHISVFTYKAWDGKKPLWRERFPAKTEAELRKMLKVADEAEWQAEFQQTPTPPDGLIFKRLSPLPTFTALPADAKGVVYCDPNLAKKGRGDSTAIVSLLYSASTDKYYVEMPVCRSFSGSNSLLEEVLKFKSNRHRAVGFDGNVNQESTWTNNVRNFCKINNTPFPFIVYCRYKTDELAKNIQGEWEEGRILLPEQITSTDDGKRFLTQIFAFAGKKANLADDAPDALICAYELLHNRRLGKKSSTSVKPVSIPDYYSF